MKEGELENNESIEEGISIEATGWIAKRDQGFSAEEQDAFFEWIAGDPRHKEMYNKRLGLWKEMNLLADWRPEHSKDPNPDLLAVRNRNRSGKRRVMAWCACAALIVFGVVGTNYWMQPNKGAVRMLVFGGAQDYESHLLDDGSVVELNRGAEVSVLYSKDKRTIFLHTGEAHFTVAKDVNRPFLVRAGDALVQATGTAFNVSLEDNGIEVLVTEGRVLVKASSVPGPESNDETSESFSQELVAGQRSVVSFLSAAINVSNTESVSFEEIDRSLSWKGEILDFAGVSLSEVVHEFNRRNRTKILITEDDLLDLKITAKLRSSNLDRFIELLEVTMDIHAQRDELSNIILRKGSDF